MLAGASVIGRAIHAPQVRNVPSNHVLYGCEIQLSYFDGTQTT
jgi:hypothetical protein